MTRLLRYVAIPLLLAALASPSAFASGRDSDGSRMQARPHRLGESARDELSPPADNVDWRYIRLGDAADVTIELSTNSGASVRVTLTDAMGKSIAGASTTDGKFTTRRRLDPGLYYIAVSSKSAVSYSLSVR